MCTTCTGNDLAMYSIQLDRQAANGKKITIAINSHQPYLTHKMLCYVKAK